MIKIFPFLRSFEAEVLEILRSLSSSSLTDVEAAVLESGLVVPGHAVSQAEARQLVAELKLYPEPDWIEFLSSVGAIYLPSMGAEDGILLGARQLQPLRESARPIYEALESGSSETSMRQYRALGFGTDAFVALPSEVLGQSVAISTRAGSTVFAATTIDGENNYLRLSMHDESVRYSSFEEFLRVESVKMLRNLTDSIAFR